MPDPNYIFLNSEDDRETIQVTLLSCGAFSCFGYAGDIFWGVLLFWLRAGTLLASDGKWVCGLFPNWEILRCF